MTKPDKNTLMVGLTANQREVVINHPQLLTDERGHGYITFSPEQARGLAHLLYRKAFEVDKCAIGIHQFCKCFQTPNGQLLFMIERGRNVIVSYLGLPKQTYMSSQRYPELMVEEVFEGIDQHSAEVESAMLMSAHSQNAATKR